MPLLLATRLMETFPESGLRNIYGLTESGPCGTTMGPDEAFEHLGTVGRPQVGVGIRVLDADGWLRSGDVGKLDEDGRAEDLLSRTHRRLQDSSSD